jgi:hypothetical protein
VKFIDLPQFVPKESYSGAVDRMVYRLCKEDGILSIYQIGHVSTPGISDIDLVAVFADDARCLADPRAGLSTEDHYLFMHNLYGVCMTDFGEGQRYSFFHNYIHLWGQNVLKEVHVFSPEEAAVLKRQVALEYLVKMYISATVEKTYGIVKLRSFLLQVKGLLYDCEFLGVTSGPLYHAVKTLVTRREAWFKAEPRLEEIIEECGALYKELTRFLSDMLGKSNLYLPPTPPYCISHNMRLLSGQRLSYRHVGIRMPSAFAFFGRKYFNLQHRLNRFEFELPLESESIPKIVHSQFQWQRRMRETNYKALPHFMTLSSSLNLSS